MKSKLTMFAVFFLKGRSQYLLQMIYSCTSSFKSFVIPSLVYVIKVKSTVTSHW